VTPPKRGYVVEELAAWSDFVSRVESYSRLMDAYAWRGQSDNSWRLESRLSREFPELAADPGWCERHLAGFKRASLGRQFDLALGEDENRWWAVGRHAGLVTPLLDWSMSPYVAAFFAFWNEGRVPTTQKCSIFCLDWGELSTLKCSKPSSLKPSDFDALKDCLVMVHPHAHDNPPMTRQSGVFTRLYPPRTDVITWVRELCDCRVDRLLVRYDIAMTERREALNSLRRMNVHPAALFPDLRGSAEFCNLGLSFANYSPLIDLASVESVAYGPRWAKSGNATKDH